MGFASADEDGAIICPVCISNLDRAATFRLPNCGHTFHTLCVATALQVCSLCPICRVAVDEETTSQIAQQIASDPSQSGSLLAAEIIMEIRAKGRSSSRETKVSPEETAKAIRAAARQGETHKIPAIAALLGHGKEAAGRPPQPSGVRLAAVEALRTLVPAFPSSWPGLPTVLELLQNTVATDADDTVRCRAATALKEVGQRGSEAALGALRVVLEDGRASADLRVQAADAVQALAMPGDPCSMRTATVALADTDCSVRCTGLSTLKTICPMRGECQEVISDFARLVGTHEDPEVRAAALELVAQAEAVGGARGIGVAAAALRDPVELVASAALAAMRRLCKPGDTDAIATMAALISQGNLQSPEPLIRAGALEVLQRIAERGDAAALTAAAMALDDADGSVRGAAVQTLKALCTRGDTRASALLLRFVDHRDSEVRRLVIEVIGYVASPQDTQVITKLRELQVGTDIDAQVAAEQALRQIC